MILLACLAWTTGFAQPRPARVHVVYAAEQAVIAAGRQEKVPVRFTVEEGYHVNSHRPASDFYLPTVLELKPADGVKLGEPAYPTGQAYTLPISPEEKLDVYTGGFTITLPVTAAAGEHTLEATLHFQACDRAACYPPKALSVQIPITAK